METPPDHLYYTLYEPAGTEIRAAILLLHGMQEHSGRYEPVANYLKERGCAVLTYDHVGHGRTAKSDPQMGFFRKDKPGEQLIADAAQMARFLSHHFPDTPLILMGHSMGSFVARILVGKTPTRFDGAIFVGTGGPNPLAALFLPVLRLANLFAPTQRSRWLNHFFLTINDRKFRHEHPNDGTNWLSRSSTNRQAFLNDKLCGVPFSNNAFYGLISLNVKATRSDWAQTIPKEMPLLFLSGACDPIGDFGKGVTKTVKKLHIQGFKRAALKIYPQLRHEILNEDEKQQVFNDLVEWLGIR